MRSKIRNVFAGVATATLLIGGGLASAAPAHAQTGPTPHAVPTAASSEPGEKVTFINTCDYRVGVTIATDWDPDAPVGAVDEVFVLDAGESRAFDNLQPTNWNPEGNNGQLYGLMYRIASDGNGSDVIQEGPLSSGSMRLVWFACGFKFTWPPPVA